MIRKIWIWLWLWDLWGGDVVLGFGFYWMIFKLFFVELCDVKFINLLIVCWELGFVLFICDFKFGFRFFDWFFFFDCFVVCSWFVMGWLWFIDCVKILLFLLNCVICFYVYCLLGCIMVFNELKIFLVFFWCWWYVFNSVIYWNVFLCRFVFYSCYCWN